MALTPHEDSTKWAAEVGRLFHVPAELAGVIACELEDIAESLAASSTACTLHLLSFPISEEL